MVGMAKLYLHIGAHKTGTTALQGAFDAGRATLARHGVTYPRACWYHHAQHRLAFALKKMADSVRGDVPDFDTELAALESTLDGVAVAVVSSEEFFALTPDRIARLRDGLAAHDVHVIATVRRPDTMFLSIYNQKAKQPGNGFGRMVSAFLDKPETLDGDISAGRCLGGWLDVFGTDRVTVLRYEDGPAVPQMLGCLGLPGDLDLPAGSANASLPGAGVEAMRLAKALKFSTEAQRNLLVVAHHTFAGYPPYYMSLEDRRRIVALFEAENAALFARLGQDNPYTPDTVSVRDDTPRPNIRMRDLMALLGEVLDDPAR